MNDFERGQKLEAFRIVRPKICEGDGCGVTFYRAAGSVERVCPNCRRKERAMCGGVVTELIVDQRRVA